MKKYMAIIAALVLCYGGIAFAAVTTGTFGDQNSSKAYRMSVDSDGIITLASDTVMTGGTITAATFTASAFNGTLGATTPSTASVTTLGASGVVTLSGVPAKTATATATKFVGVGSDGILYGVQSTISTVGNVGIGTTTVGSQLVVGTTGGFTVSSAGAVSAPTVAASTGVGIGTTNVGAGLNVGTTSQFTVSAAGVITDTGLYAATSGTGLNRTLCVDSNGKIFSSAAACP